MSGKLPIPAHARSKRKHWPNQGRPPSGNHLERQRAQREIDAIRREREDERIRQFRPKRVWVSDLKTPLRLRGVCPNCGGTMFELVTDAPSYLDTTRARGEIHCVTCTLTVVDLMIGQGWHVSPLPDHEPVLKRWAKHYDCCRICGTTKVEHKGNGRCNTCSSYYQSTGREREVQ